MSARFSTIPEFCARRKISRSYAYQELRAGRLKGKKIGDKTVIGDDAEEEWANQLPDYPVDNRELAA